MISRVRFAAAVVLSTSLIVAGLASPASAKRDAANASTLLDITRIGGADRYDVAANVAQKLKKVAHPVIYLATGENFPDALSAGPATQPIRAQLLLTARDHIPQSVASEIKRIDPEEIVIVGGTNSITSNVVEELLALVPLAHLRRIGGIDRYEVSRKVIMSTFEPALHLNPHVATGVNFPDALSAGAAAAFRGSPVLLVPGRASSVDADTRAEFSALQTDEIVVVGGEASVSAGIFNDLGGIAPTSRVGGANRYLVSLAVNQQTFSSADTAYLATGEKFPDALTGGVLAGQNSSPLYIVPGTCVPRGVLDDFTRLGVEHVVLIGGTASLSDAVARLEPCV
jgi:putative cell wall-binding protein